MQIKVSSGRTISVGVWDTAGAEQFEALSRMYYHGSRAAIVCFDASQASSFGKLKFWVRLRCCSLSCPHPMSLQYSRACYCAGDCGMRATRWKS